MASLFTSSVKVAQVTASAITVKKPPDGSDVFYVQIGQHGFSLERDALSNMGYTFDMRGAFLFQALVALLNAGIDPATADAATLTSTLNGMTFQGVNP